MSKKILAAKNKNKAAPSKLSLLVKKLLPGKTPPAKPAAKKIPPKPAAPKKTAAKPVTKKNGNKKS